MLFFREYSLDIFEILCRSFPPLFVEGYVQDFIPKREDRAVNLSVLVEFCIMGESLVQSKHWLQLGLCDWKTKSAYLRTFQVGQVH